MFSEVCNYCKHYHIEAVGNKCDAFPDAIPDEIWFGKNDHKKPYKGDGGIMFEHV